MGKGVPLLGKEGLWQVRDLLGGLSFDDPKLAKLYHQSNLPEYDFAEYC